MAKSAFRKHTARRDRVPPCITLPSARAHIWLTQWPIPHRHLLLRILHPPGEDNYGYESASERWLPVHTVESIMVSVISMLSSPNDESPANIDAAKEWRDDPEAFRKRVGRCVRKSQDSL